jgi:hypothetical protein
MEAFRALFEMAKRGLLRAKIEKACPLSQVQEAVTSHKENGAAKLFSNLQLGGGCASLEERSVPSPN